MTALGRSSWGFLILWMAVLSSCSSPTPQTHVPPTQTPIVVPSPTATPTSTPTPVPAPTPTPVPFPLSITYSAEANAFRDEGAVTRLGIGTYEVARLSPDEKLMAVGGSTGVHVFDVATFEHVWSASTPLPVNDLAWSPDGRLLAVGLWQYGGLVLDTQTGEERFSFSVYHTAEEGMRGIAVSFSPDGRLVATAGCVRVTDVGTCERVAIYLWDAVTGLQVNVLEYDTFFPPESFTWSPDSRIVVGTSLQASVMWDIVADRQLAFPADFGAYPHVFFSPDWTKVAFATEAGIEIREWPSGASLYTIPLERDNGTETLDWSPDGSKLAAYLGTIRGPAKSYIFDLTTGNLTPLERTYLFTFLPPNYAWSADSTRFAAAGLDPDKLPIWDTRTGEVIASVDIETGNSSLLVGLTANDAIVIGWNNSMIAKYDLASQRLTATLVGTSPVLSVAWSSDGRELAAGDDSEIVVWNPRTGKPVRTCVPQGETTRDFFPLLWHRSPSLISLPWAEWDADTCNMVPGGAAAGLAPISPDGQFLAMSREDATEIIEAAIPHREIMSWGEYLKNVQLTWSYDGSRLLYAGYDGYGTVVVIRDIQASRPIYEQMMPDGDFVGVACCSPDGTRMVLLDGTRDPDDYFLSFTTFVLSVVNIETGETVFSRDVTEETPRGTGGASVAWSLDGKIIALGYAGYSPNPGPSFGITGSLSNIINLWSAEDGRLLKTFRGHTNTIFDLAWSPDGKKLASGSVDGTIIIWDVSQ